MASASALSGCDDFEIARFSGEQHGAAAERHLCLDIAVLAGNGERGERAFPIAGAGLHVEQRVDAPACARIGVHRLLGEGAGSVVVVAALGLEEQAAQAEKLRLRPVEHGLEGAPRRGAVALELRGLGFEQRGERLVRQIAPRHARVALRLGPVADADGEQTAGQRIEALAAAALLHIGGHGGGTREEIAQQGPGKHQHRDESGKRQRADEGAGLDLVAKPLDGDRAWPVGEPAEGQGGGNDANDEEEDADHRVRALLQGRGRRRTRAPRFRACSTWRWLRGARAHRRASRRKRRERALAALRPP